MRYIRVSTQTDPNLLITNFQPGHPSWGEASFFGHVWGEKSRFGMGRDLKSSIDQPMDSSPAMLRRISIGLGEDEMKSANVCI